MDQRTWIVQRAVLAVCLLVGFYVLAIGIAVGLLWIPYAQWTYANSANVKILVVCVGSAGAILWALIPRADEFVPPGPLLQKATHPDLFRVIEEAAAGTQQAMPEDVYLLNEVNAWVTHRGGTMGFGSRRVMGIGLPLLQTLTVPELKAVIAHEFGHYHGGDVAIGPWIYKTRAAIARTVSGVGDTWFAHVFLWYGRQFLKVTHAVSRRQEFIADAMAAQLYGADAMAGALRRTAWLAPMFMSYVSNEVMPVIHAGFLPPFSAGFDQFLRDEKVVETSERLLTAAESETQADPFDTHPTLRERLTALGVNERAAPQTEAPALSLIGDADRLGVALIQHALGEEPTAQLKRIPWEQVGTQVYVPSWRNVTKHYAELLSRFSVDNLPADKNEFISVGSKLLHPDEPQELVNDEARLARAGFLLSAGICAVLVDRGWHAETFPGKPIAFIRDDAKLEPFAAVRAIADGTVTADSWKQQCSALGIAGIPLGSA